MVGASSQPPLISTADRLGQRDKVCSGGCGVLSTDQSPSLAQHAPRWWLGVSSTNQPPFHYVTIATKSDPLTVTDFTTATVRRHHRHASSCPTDKNSCRAPLKRGLPLTAIHSSHAHQHWPRTAFTSDLTVSCHVLHLPPHTRTHTNSAVQMTNFITAQKHFIFGC